MDGRASISGGIMRTAVRGWAVALLSRVQVSSVVLVSYTLGVFLPFVNRDLHLSPLQAGLLQSVWSVWWISSALLSLPWGLWWSGSSPT